MAQALPVVAPLYVGALEGRGSLGGGLAADRLYLADVRTLHEALHVAADPGAAAIPNLRPEYTVCPTGKQCRRSIPPAFLLLRGQPGR